MNIIICGGYCSLTTLQNFSSESYDKKKFKIIITKRIKNVAFKIEKKIRQDENVNNSHVYT